MAYFLCRTVLSSVASLAVSCSSTLSHTRHNFRKKLIIKCAFLFSLHLLSEPFPILRSIQRDVIINVPGSLCKLLVIIVRLQSNLNFLDRFSKNPQV
jgi:hypothetical protein